MKFILFLITTIIFAVVYLPIIFILLPWRIRMGPFLMQVYCRACLSIFRVKVKNPSQISLKKIKKINDIKKSGFVILSNHISFLDIFILSGYFRAVFVSKVEVKYYPVIGQISWLLGLIFLERNSAEERHNIIRVIAEESKRRIIAIFPQGTTSSPAMPLPFKCGIFKTLEVNNKIIMIPLTIYYEEADKIVWGENQLLIENVKNVCALKRIHAEIKIHKKITVNDLTDKTITELCANIEKTVLLTA